MSQLLSELAVQGSIGNHRANVQFTLERMCLNCYVETEG